MWLRLIAETDARSVGDIEIGASVGYSTHQLVLRRWMRRIQTINIQESFNAAI